MSVTTDSNLTSTASWPTTRWNQDWIRACVVGELVGFVPPAVTGATLVALDVPELVLVFGLVLAGVVEGFILGRTQSQVLRRSFPRITGWAGTTAIAAGLAWLAGMGGSALVGALGPAGLLIAVPGWIIGLLAMGVLQSRRLATVVRDARAWIPVTTIAWLIGVSIPVIALSAIPNQWPLVVHVIVAICSAVAMGATVGAITGATLNRYIEQGNSIEQGTRVQGQHYDLHRSKKTLRTIIRQPSADG